MHRFAFFRYRVGVMSDYEFVSVWTIAAPIDSVWDAIKRSEDWPAWWKGVLSVIELKPGDVDGIGAVHRSTWKSALPYTLEFDSEVVRMEKQRLIEARAFGELDGRGVWRFEQTETGTRVQYDWTVKTTKAWMNLIAPIAKPLFKWSHDIIMNWGEEGLRKLLTSR